ncbi:MAG: hypothetical protein M1470_08970 [Bacteroidetes bacterium]|nr:hypothetical protein [Bacteroidota bacterium]MCL5737311.1 hypothetical protein [Bacteroidota bacterium]
MRTITLMLLLSLVAAGCGLVNSNVGATKGVTATFDLTDMTGHSDTTFAVGQNFYMTFRLINGGPDTVTYSDPTVPPIHFEILKNDSVIGATVYAVMNVVVIPPSKLLPGKSLDGQCEAPVDLKTISPQHTLVPVVLSPGSYIAKASYPTISGANVTDTSVVGFTVHQ